VFRDPQRIGRGAQHLAGHRQTGLKQRVVGNHLRDQAGAQGAGRVHRPAGQQHLPRGGEADGALQPPADAELAG
jgi:hypothetical protein